MARPTPAVLRPKLDPTSIERLRSRIQGGQLVTRLQDFALGTLVMDTTNDTPRLMVEMADGTRKPAMSKEQIQAARALLDKLLPTPQSIAVTSEETKTFVLRAPEPSKSTEDWLREYAPKAAITLKADEVKQ